MPEPLTQAQIDAVVARAAGTVRARAPEPDLVFALPGTPARAAGTAPADGWCDVGTVVDVPGGRAYAVWWHPALRRARLER